MNENEVSRTALFTAFFRGYHALHDSPKIFDDFLAWQFLTAEERGSFESGFRAAFQNADPVRAGSFSDQTAALRWLMQRIAALPITIGRARYAEDILAEAVGELGEPMQAGFDPFTLAGELAPLGLHVREDLCPVDIQERYFWGRTDDYSASEHAHFVCAVVDQLHPSFQQRKGV